ncbi:MAG: hypothetical protein ACYS8I_08345 [Planctomycetota bacterium]
MRRQPISVTLLPRTIELADTLIPVLDQPSRSHVIELLVRLAAKEHLASEDVEAQCDTH